MKYFFHETIFKAFVPHFYLCCTHCIIPENLLNNLNSFRGGTFKFNTKFDADLLLCLLNQFECAGHTVHMLTQPCPVIPLTSTVKSSSSTHVHSSTLSLAARLHCCQANHFCYINNRWTFSRQTLYTFKKSVCFWIFLDSQLSLNISVYSSTHVYLDIFH